MEILTERTLVKVAIATAIAILILFAVGALCGSFALIRETLYV